MKIIFEAETVVLRPESTRNLVTGPVDTLHFLRHLEKQLVNVGE